MKPKYRRLYKIECKDESVYLYETFSNIDIGKNDEFKIQLLSFLIDEVKRSEAADQDPVHLLLHRGDWNRQPAANDVALKERAVDSLSYFSHEVYDFNYKQVIMQVFAGNTRKAIDNLTQLPLIKKGFQLREQLLWTGKADLKCLNENLNTNFINAAEIKTWIEDNYAL